MNVESLESVKRELAELRGVLASKSNSYVAAKNLISQAKECLARNKDGKCLELLRKAKREIEREDRISSQLEALKNTITFSNGVSMRLYNSIKQEILSGNLDMAERQINELENVITRERALKSIIDEVNSLIEKKVSGSNPEEAEKLKSEAVSKLLEGEFEEAEKLLEQAKLSAKPTPDYLLSRAKSLSEEAERHFESIEFEKSIELWRSSIEEYARAKEAALERGDKTLSERIDETISVLKGNIEKAEIARDNRDMLRFVSEANEKTDRGNALFENQEFDRAREEYEAALDLYSKALNLAEKREFPEKDMILEAMESVKTSIESCLIAKGAKLLDDTEKDLEEKPEEAENVEKKFRDILEYINSIQVRDDESLQILKNRASRGIINSMVKQAENQMKKAEELFSDKKYYDAKELYTKTEDFLRRVADKAASLNVTEEMDYIFNLRDTCIENERRATDMLLGIRSVEWEPERVSEVRRGAAAVRLRSTDRPVRGHPVEDLLTEYERLEYIGGGGFADVYKAEKDGSVFAIKVPRELSEKEETVFFNEVRKWEELKHRNIVNLIKPRLRPKPHLVLEYVDGKSLDKLIGKLSVEEACRIAFDIARALEYAHSKHILHCDLKPKNILVSKVGEAKVTDFGLATGLGSSLKGLTLAYAAPETVKGKRPDERTDVYQLGLIFYEMLTGFNPFIEGDGNLKNRIADLVPDPPSKFRPEVEPLDDLIMRCLSKNPDERPSIREFRETVYEYMKKYHNDSLHLTKDYETMARKAIRLAFYAVKQNDLKTALAEMEFAAGKVKAELREECNAIAERLRYMLRENLGTTEELMMMVETLMKKL